MFRTKCASCAIAFSFFCMCNFFAPPPSGASHPPILSVVIRAIRHKSVSFIDNAPLEDKTTDTGRIRRSLSKSYLNVRRHIRANLREADQVAAAPLNRKKH